MMIQKQAFCLHEVHAGNEDMCFLPQGHAQWELVYVQKGSLELLCNGQKCTVHTDELAVINPFQIHTASAGGEGVVYTSLTVSEMFLNTDDEETRQWVAPLFRGRVQFGPVIRDEQITELFLNCIHEYQQNAEACVLSIKAFLYRILAQMYRLWKRECTAGVSKNEEFCRVLAYIEDTVTESVTTAQIAEQFSFDESYLCRKFRKYTGMTVLQYKTYLRLKQAGLLLTSADNTVAEVGAACGFDDPNYFTRVFTAFYGVSPTAWRNRVADVEAEPSKTTQTATEPLHEVQEDTPAKDMPVWLF